MSTDPTFDIFISYSHHDEDWVRSRLLRRLEAAGLRVCIDFRDFEPGLPSLVNMENAVERSHKTLIVLTPAWVKSEWTAFESLLIQTDDPAGRRRRMIPLLLKPCDPPRRIAMLTYLDFTDPPQFDFQMSRLVRAIKPDIDRIEEKRPLKELLMEPIPATPYFIGRGKELAAYREELQRERIVIIKGMAGVGKTTLGAKLAREEAEREEQIFWFTFDPVEKNTAEALFWALAAFLESRKQPDLWRYLQGEIGSQKPLGETVKLNLFLSGLASGDYLLCFDDFQVVKDAPDVAHFFKLIHQRFVGRRQDLPARFIIMGREVPPEMEYLVSESLRGFNKEEGRAFVEDRNLRLPPALLQRLWDRTEGNPQLLDLSVSALAAMDGNLAAMEDFIEAMARRGDIRDYLMTNIYAVLQPEEKIVVGVLSVFPTPVRWEVAEDILAAEGITGVVPCIDALLNKHIVSEAKDGRIHCHGLVREYCYRVLDREDRERFHQRAADYYEQEENYLAAAHHHFERGAQGQALNLLTANAQTIINDGGAGALLEQLARFQRRRLGSKQWVALCQARGDGYRMRGEYRQALEAYEAALGEATEEEARAELLRRIGITYDIGLGEYGQAVEHFMNSLDISKTLEDQASMADAYHAMGWAYYRLDRLEQARECFTVSQEIGQELGDKLLLAKTDLGLGLIDWREGQLEEARVRFEESRRIFRAFGERMREAFAVGNLGLIYGEIGDLDRELSYYRQAVEIQEEIGDVYGLRIAYNNLGNLYHLLRNHAQAIHYYEQLAQLAQDTGHKPMLNTAYSGLADVHLALGDPQRGLEYAQDARRIAQDIGPGVELGVSWRVLGEVWTALGDPAQAKACFEQSIPFLEEAKEYEELERAQRGLEKALSQLGADSSSQKEE
jgi:tetratricopeptide (TPR) repeat protein